jgi:hypothetical protein
MVSTECHLRIRWARRRVFLVIDGHASGEAGSTVVQLISHATPAKHAVDKNPCPPQSTLTRT